MVGAGVLVHKGDRMVDALGSEPSVKRVPTRSLVGIDGTAGLDACLRHHRTKGLLRSREGLGQHLMWEVAG